MNRDESASGVRNNRDRVTLNKPATRHRPVALARHGTALWRHKLANKNDESTGEIITLTKVMQVAEECNRYPSKAWDWVL